MTDQELVNQAHEAKDNLTEALRQCHDAGLEFAVETDYIDNPNSPDPRPVFLGVLLHVSRQLEPNSKP